MTVSQRSIQGSPVRSLSFLLQDVVDARTTLAEERRSPRSPTGSNHVARADLLTALEAYTAALTRHRLPVPYGLRDELRIRRSACR